ncbi:glutaredoxin family protein [Citricoccus nitrophenolicus]|uniref:Glutaredoxin family protein n=1 Tax=Citricoccus nitrophenolicus TaxID=863575 RepID=A0ABV0ILQ9_9MICC
MTIQPSLFPSEDDMLIVSGTESCVQCNAAKRLLDKENAPYEFIDLEKNPAKLAELRAAGFRQMPVIETPTERFTGFDPDRVKRAAAEIRSATATHGVTVVASERALT